ncbi:uncharacterized protein [Phaseolus vulgaris]|uniref:uncharacterized protein n=1 Tax=Phaseolus vulgaris TaxID=3885 RepID=UPI0035CA8048
MTDKAMSMILELLEDAFDYAKIPCSFYEAKKIIKKLGLHYTKIDACPNDCMLYYGEDKDKEVCKKCNESRWKRRKKNKTIDGTMKKQKKVPAKVLRYFPLKPRLQRMFMSSKIAEHMHDARNVRLGLAADGFNPFGDLSTSHSTWPIAGSLSMIIPAKRAPGNDIDVYLRRLIEELKELWNNRVKTFDSYSNEVFNMHAAILWTISDFPGLETLSGWNTHTGLACPRCNFDTTPKKIQGKFCFMNHRRWLNARHKFRLARIHFDGSVENRNPPLTISGIDVLRQVENVNIIFGKEPEVEELGKRQRRDHQAIDGPLQWRKKSIFFELPYWEKKSKDNLKARKDLKDWGVRPDLWPDENNKYLPAIYTLTKENKHTFLTTLKNITVPDGYSSNISRCVDVKQCKLGGLKSHDSHVLMEQLLPLAMRKTLPKEVCYVLIDLCSFFRNLCSKVLKVDELNQLQNRVVLTLCHMEILFPPAFFTIMVHLIVHLVEDVELGGPV